MERKYVEEGEESRMEKCVGREGAGEEGVAWESGAVQAGECLGTCSINGWGVWLREGDGGCYSASQRLSEVRRKRSVTSKFTRQEN